MPSKVLDGITYSFLNFSRWSLWIDKLFHPTLYYGCIYLCMLGLNLIHVIKKGPWLSSDKSSEATNHMSFYRVRIHWNFKHHNQIFNNSRTFTNILPFLMNWNVQMTELHTLKTCAIYCGDFKGGYQNSSCKIRSWPICIFLHGLWLASCQSW